MRTTRSTPAQLWLTRQVNNPVGLEAVLTPIEDPDGELDEGNEEHLMGIDQFSCHYNQVSLKLPTMN